MLLQCFTRCIMINAGKQLTQEIFNLLSFINPLSPHRQCIEAAVEGCLALVLRGKSNADRLTRQQLNGGSPPLPLEPMSPKDGIGMLEKFASTAQVRGELRTYLYSGAK